MEYIYETHCHSAQCSLCAKSSAQALVYAYHKAGYTGLVLTDHFIYGNTAVPQDLPWEVFLMGLAQAERIAHRLLAAGKSPDTPAAVLSGGNSILPACIRTILEDLPQAAKKIQPPAIILVGEVAAVDLSH